MRWLPGKKPSDPVRILWLVFWVWITVGFLFLGLKIDYQWVGRQDLNPWLKNFFLGSIHWGDFVFNVLAFLNVYFAAVERLGLAKARKSMLIILPASAALEYIGTQTGYPFGAYGYTDAFGPQLFGVVPMAIPLAWFSIVAGGYLLLSQYLPTWNRIQLSLGTGLLAVFLDWIMEPFAYGVREYWIWGDGSVPWQNYASWFAAAAVLACLCPLQAPSRANPDVRPAVILGAMLLTFVLGRLVYGV